MRAGENGTSIAKFKTTIYKAGRRVYNHWPAITGFYKTGNRGGPGPETESKHSQRLIQHYKVHCHSLLFKGTLPTSQFTQRREF
jgi:hypothetical protein